MKRLCFFAGYNHNGVISDYVVYYIKEMSKLSDVYYMADCETKEEELAKLAPYVKAAYSYRHKKYDFGSWQELMWKLGKEEMSNYDELVLCNDSCFGPLFPLEPIFGKASKDNECDFWGMTEEFYKHPHIQSYFMVFKKKVFSSEVFESFFNNIRQLPKEQVIVEYEIGLSKILVEKGFVPKVYISSVFELYNFWADMIKRGLPFLKIGTFKTKPLHKSKQRLSVWEKVLKQKTNYDVTLIKQHFDLIGLDYKYFQSVKRKFVEATNWFFRAHFHKNVKVLRIFGFYLVDNREETRGKNRQFKQLVK